MVKVSVTINDTTHTLNYPVLNSYNKSLKVEAYEYTTKKGKNIVAPASTFDINTSILRALTKCIALFGLSIFLYQDEMQPDIETVDSKQLQEITDAIRAKGLILSEVCKSWNLGKLAQLHANNADNMLEWLEQQKGK